jgi:hypothetical protein
VSEPDRVLIPYAAAREAETRMTARAIADAEAQAFVRGVAMGLGIDPARIVTIDTTHDELVLEPLPFEVPPTEHVGAHAEDEQHES